MIRGSHHRLCWIAPLCLAASVAASAQSSAPAVAARAPVTWLLVVDDLHLDFRNTGRIRNAMKTMVAELIQEGDKFAIASAGPSALAVDVTVDRQSLDAAIKKTTGNGLRFDDVIQGPNGASEARYRASIALAAAHSMLDTGSRAPGGPTALLYISSGFSVDILPDGAPTSPPLRQGFNVTRSEVREQLTQLTARATRAAIRIFAIDPRVAFDDPVPDPRDPAWPAHRAAMTSVLRSISDGSGGFAIVDDDFVTQLRRIADTMRR